MSSIIFKGDTVKNFGEFYPNIYIDGVVVRNNGPDHVFMDISYTLLFHITDEFNQEDIIEILENVNFYFAVSDRTDRTTQLLTKNELISDMSRADFLESVPLLETKFYPFSKENILQNLTNNLFTSDVYDSQDRQVLLVSSEETINYSIAINLDNATTPEVIQLRELGIEEGSVKNDSHVYLYAFTSLYGVSEFNSLNRTATALKSDAFYNLSISNVSYEKIFSPNLNILTQTVEAYFDIEGQKYPDVPILSLNGIYYKTETVKRELIIEKVSDLTKRFASTKSSESLQQMVDSINYVLSTFGATENLLIELDRIRKSSPNKTNNNRVGNLYAALSKLLININSAFLDGERLTKDRILTGKVVDKREEIRYDLRTPSIPPADLIIPNDGFFIDRNRLSDDEFEDLSSNSGFFHVRYERIIKNVSKLSKLFDVERMFEFPLPSLREEMQTLLFSYVKAKRINMYKYDGDGNGLLSNGITYDNITREVNETGGSVLPGEQSDSARGLNTYIKEYFLDLNGPTPEKITSYEFYDLDRYPATYEMLENENGGMKFRYDILAEFEDNSMTLVSTIEKMFLAARNALGVYYDLANEVCSYNNIQNRFNNFFVIEIDKYYAEREISAVPWNFAVYVYSFIQYILTDRFENVSDVAKYCRNMIKSISPASGTLQSIQELLLEMEQFQDTVLGSGTEFFNKKIELFETTNEIVFENSFDVQIITQRQDRLSREAESEIQYFVDLFKDNNIYVYVDSADSSRTFSLRSNGTPGGKVTNYILPEDPNDFNFIQVSRTVFYENYVKSQLPGLFSNVTFRLIDINRISGTDGAKYNYGGGTPFTHNLSQIMGMGIGAGPTDLYKLLNSTHRQGIIDKVATFLGNWLADTMYAAKKFRDTQLRAGMFGDVTGLMATGGEVRDQATASGTQDRGTMANGVYYIAKVVDGGLEAAFKQAFYEALLELEGGSLPDRNESTVKSYIYGFYVPQGTASALSSMVQAIFAYYRETNFNVGDGRLFPDLIPTGISTAQDIANKTNRAASDRYLAIKDPTTVLPDFITDEDPYITYTGPELSDIPGLLEQLADSSLE